MIDEVRFLGMEMGSRRQRRWLVVGYYMLLVVFSAMGLMKPHWLVRSFLPQTIFLVGLLGGIQGGGPVKPYSGRPILPLDAGDAPLELKLTARTGGREGSYELDEREMHEQDAAHFTAYRMLRLGLGVAALLYLLGLAWFAPWVESRSPVLLWVLLVVVLSLPQAVILWREPNVARD